MKEIIKQLLREALDTTITCEKCGWDWQKSESGPDMYFCHKCGHDNTPDNIKETLESIDSLEEAKQVGYLYHFTNYTSMIKIIESGFILTSPIQPYVSFTRNKGMVSNTISQDVRITINGNRLSTRYAITPYADVKAGYGRYAFSSGSDESEERISLSKYPNGVNISNYIVSIDVKKPTYDLSVYDDTDDEESYEPPKLSGFISLIELLKEKKIPFKLV